MLNLAHFWLPFGALWLTLGSLWLTLGSLLVPFGSLLVPWAHFWRSWRSIFSLLVPPSVIFHISFYNMDGILVPKREAQFFSFFVSPDTFSLLRFTTWMGYQFENEHTGTFMHYHRHLSHTYFEGTFHVNSCFEKVSPIFILWMDIYSFYGFIYANCFLLFQNLPWWFRVGWAFSALYVLSLRFLHACHILFSLSLVELSMSRFRHASQAGEGGQALTRQLILY